MPSFKCSDIGMQCGFQVDAPSREELLVKIGMHAHEAHQMKLVPPEVLQKIQNSIKY
jgi:predicted small metal-binding protein